VVDLAEATASVLNRPVVNCGLSAEQLPMNDAPSHVFAGRNVIAGFEGQIHDSYLVASVSE
jgi:hypothetical protein